MAICSYPRDNLNDPRRETASAVAGDRGGCTIPTEDQVQESEQNASDAPHGTWAGIVR